jgi:zinc protease
MELADPQATSAKALDIIQFNLPKDYYSGYPSRVEKFTPEDLRKTAEKVFPANDLNVIVTGDASKIISKLERFGKFKTYDLDLKEIAKVETALKPSPLSLEQVIDKYWAAINKPALEKVTSIEKNSTITIMDATASYPGTMQEVSMAPNLRYETFTIQSVPKIDRKNNGTKIYEYQGGQLTRGIEGRELADEQSFVMFNKELMIKDPLQNAKLRGIAETQFGDCYVFTLDKVGAGKETWYISDKTGYLVRRIQETKDGDVMYDYSDFKKVNDIPMPFKTVITGPMSMNVDYTDIKFNTNPDKTLFEIK